MDTCRDGLLKLPSYLSTDSFQDRVNKTVIDSLLQSAADVHMNILRVWGGGIYEQDYFYNRADELGYVLKNLTEKNELTSN